MFRKKINSTYGIIKAAVSLLLVISLTGCSLSGGDKKAENTKAPASTVKQAEVKTLSKEDAFAKAAQYLKNMSVEQKVGQLFVVNLEQLDSSKGSYYEWKKCSKKMKEAIKKNCIGGEVARIAGNPDMKTTKYPSMEDVGKKKDADYVNNMGKTIGNDIKKLGFNVDFAPVADVKTSNLNLEIGSRSFGKDPNKVAELVEAFVKGIQSTNVSATLKHFPGQGSSKGDTHIENVNIDSSIAALRKVDFVPFEKGIKAGADFVMVSHISVSRVTETAQPASMSELIMKTILREELGFEGVIITDAMDMASITDKYSSEEAALGAFEAGADIILMPTDFEEAYKNILSAVDSGEIGMDRLDESVQRILTVKFMRGIIPENVDSPVQAATAQAVTITPQ